MATVSRKRSITSKESINFMKEALEDFHYIGANWSNHKKTRSVDDTYQITVDMISDGALSALLEHEWVKDVFYHPSMAPVGYGIAMRYRLYVSYNKIPIRPRTKRK